jgi:hypothetical protein
MKHSLLLLVGIIWGFSVYAQIYLNQAWEKLILLK